MSKKQFKGLRSVAISWCEKWVDYCLAKSEEFANAGDQINALVAFEHAEEAERVANWLRKANKTDFLWWKARYETEGIAYISAQQQALF